METPFPAVDQVTPEWLTAILRANGHLDSGRVVAVRPRGGASPAEGGPGFRPDHRLEVSYSHDAPPSAPAQLYFKAGAGVVDSLAGKREVAFYRELAPAMTQSPGLPCYGAAYDPESSAYWLLLRDISDTHVTVEREAPAPRRDMEIALGLLASLHAFWWGRLQPAGEVGLVDAALIDRQDTYDFSGYVDYLGDRLSAERLHIYERVLASLPGLLKRRLSEAGALTLVHDDAHIWNFLLPRDQVGDRVYLVDWEQWGASVGPHDVAYMIGLFWYRERRVRMEEDLVRYYHSRLLDGGVADYSWDACWHDYRLFMIRNLMVPLWAWTWAHRGGWRWGFHRWMQLEKAMLAFEDLKCAELLAG